MGFRDYGFSGTCVLVIRFFLNGGKFQNGRHLCKVSLPNLLGLFGYQEVEEMKNGETFLFDTCLSERTKTNSESYMLKPRMVIITFQLDLLLQKLETTNCRKTDDGNPINSANTDIYAYSETTCGGTNLGCVMTANWIYGCCRFLGCE